MMVVIDDDDECGEYGRKDGVYFGDDDGVNSMVKRL